MDHIVRPYQRGEEEYVAQVHRRIYSEEYRWGKSFTDYAEQIALRFPERGADPREELWIAEADGHPVGSIMLCRTEEEGVGQLRLFLVEKAYRRRGIGASLTGVLLQKAREIGCRELILWTASPLTDAIRQYERLGFREEERVDNRDWSLDGETVQEVLMRMPL